MIATTSSMNSRRCHTATKRIEESIHISDGNNRFEGFDDYFSSHNAIIKHSLIGRLQQEFTRFKLTLRQHCDAIQMHVQLQDNTKTSIKFPRPHNEPKHPAQ